MSNASLSRNQKLFLAALKRKFTEDDTATSIVFGNKGGGKLFSIPEECMKIPYDLTANYSMICEQALHRDKGHGILLRFLS